MRRTRSEILQIFTGNTGRTTTTRSLHEPDITHMCGFTPSFARECRAHRAPVPDFRPSGFEGVDEGVIRRLEAMEGRRGR